jgi:hypothetical protein
MASNPKPKQIFRNFYGKRSMVKANTHSSVFANLLKVQ